MSNITLFQNKQVPTALRKDARGVSENKIVAQAGGSVPGKAREDLEAKSGTQVSIRANFIILASVSPRTRAANRKQINRHA